MLLDKKCFYEFKKMQFYFNVLGLNQKKKKNKTKKSFAFIPRHRHSFQNTIQNELNYDEKK